MQIKSLRELRIERQWSQDELAKFVGVTSKTIQRAEGGAPLRLETVRKLAHVLGLQPEQMAAVWAAGRSKVDDAAYDKKES